jgi:hypothetical protein
MRDDEGTLKYRNVGVNVECRGHVRVRPYNSHAI